MNKDVKVEVFCVSAPLTQADAEKLQQTMLNLLNEGWEITSQLASCYCMVYTLERAKNATQGQYAK